MIFSGATPSVPYSTHRRGRLKHGQPSLRSAAVRAVAIARREALQTEAGWLITISPDCSRWASRRADAITTALDRLNGVEVVW